MGENTKYVPEGVFLVCDKGDIPTQLICDAHPINIYSVKYADENDNKPILNIQSFGTCKTLGTCAPPPGFTWINVKEDVRLHGSKPLLETSECLCPAGAGKIKIFLDEYAAFLAAENNSESSFVSEPISSKALGIAGLGLFGPVLSMLAPDFTEGVGRGIKKGAEGTWNFLTRDMWQADTWKGLGRTAVVAAVYGLNANKPAGTIQSDMMLRSLDNRFGTSFVPTRDALATGIERGVSHAIEDVRRGNWGEVGESVGQIEYAVVEAVVGTKGAGLALKGAKAATVAAVGAQRLAQIAAATSRVMQRMRSVSGIVRIGRKSTVYRVQGGLPPNASWKRVTFAKNGAVNIEGEQMLYVNIDDLDHAVYFYNKRGGAAGGAEIVKFRIPRRLAEEIKREAVPQDMGRKFPNKPQISDPTKSSSAYGLPKEWIDRLNTEAIRGSGEIIKP